MGAFFKKVYSCIHACLWLGSQAIKSFHLPFAELVDIKKSVSRHSFVIAIFGDRVCCDTAVKQLGLQLAC